VEELGVPLIVHGNRFEGRGVAAMERLDHMHLDNALGFLFEGTLAITSLIMFGVLDLFPRLRVGVLETGAGYLPYLMNRLQEVYEGEVYGGIAPNPGVKVRDMILKPPAHYLDQFWVCANLACEAVDIPYLVQRFGAQHLLINSDYPHGLGGPGERAIEIVRGIDGITRDQQDQILGANACALFGIDPESRQQARTEAQADGRVPAAVGPSV
jgi:predicted TIM-barrel fold metal-dependent hydrolase